MAKINLADYTVDIDNMNATVHYNYIGKDKDDNPKEAKKLIGYFPPNCKGCQQAIEAIIRHGISQEDVLTLEELKSFFQISKDEIDSWVKEAWGK